MRHRHTSRHRVRDLHGPVRIAKRCLPLSSSPTSIPARVECGGTKSSGANNRVDGHESPPPPPSKPTVNRGRRKMLLHRRRLGSLRESIRVMLGDPRQRKRYGEIR
eukprot:4257824-Pleurochrysis_carterae.AAC.1